MLVEAVDLGWRDVEIPAMMLGNASAPEEPPDNQRSLARGDEALPASVVVCAVPVAALARQDQRRPAGAAGE